MAFCSKCGTQNADGTNNCTQCGASLQQAPTPQPAPAKKKKSIFKRWWFWVLIIIVVIVVAASLGGDDTGDGGNGGGSSPTQGQTEGSKTMNGSGTLGDYHLEIVSVRIGKASYGSDEYIIVKYKWTNNSSSAISFSFAFDDKVYQDDVECLSSILGDDKYEANQDLSDLKAGGTQELEVSYKKNSNSRIDVEVGRYSFFDEKQVVKSFDIK